MAGYLILNDYNVTIQTPALNQWLASNDALRIQAEPRAQAKIKEYLVQKYDLSTEFQPTYVYADSAIYQANALVQLNFLAWTAQSYTVGTYVSYTDGNVYRCIANATSTELPGNTAFWLLVGTQYGLEYLAYPYPVFSGQGVYAIGDRVFWKGKIYQALIATTIPSHYSDLQSWKYENIPGLNYFPDDKVNGATYWGAGTTYQVSGIYPNFVATQGYWDSSVPYYIGDTVMYNGVLWQSLRGNNQGFTPGSDIVSWQSIQWNVGDNRNQSIVDAYVALTLYYLSFRLSPKVVPTWVQSKYDAALAWLQSGAEGNITLDIPEIQPSQGSRIRYGGLVKQWNGY